jgi:hypothetical protein
MKPLLIVLMALAVTLTSNGCGADQQAGVRVDLVGQPTPSTLTAEPGKCNSITKASVGGTATAECGVPVGRVTFTVQCQGGERRAAVLTITVPRGTSHYVQFNDVCVSNAEQIAGGNEQSAGKSIWRPST